MIEILDDLGVLTRADLDLSVLSLAGVPYDSIADQYVEYDRITEVTFSPIVRMSRSSGGTWLDHYDADGKLLNRAQVIDSIIHTTGMLHFADHTSCLVKDGKIAGFALTGGRQGHLAHFSHLNSYEEFLAAFGSPDQVQEGWAMGDLMTYSNHYRASFKMARWDCWNERLSLVNLGQYEDNLRSAQGVLD
ncbi:hypothetical protein ACFXHA_15000 [Nocardia sp. NPDC059240]|uniref:hypothetical protein n=1 Tax=Nocardia sp. NPDC059240 TaxID=3346786 RepID=UPI00369A298C